MFVGHTHSLIAALLWSAGAFAICRLTRRRDGTTAALAVAAAVFSHWVLDFIVHRPDLPLYDDAVKVGLGLWNLPALAFGIRNRASAEYFVRWIDKLQVMAEAWPGWRSQAEKDHVFAQFSEARKVYQRLAREEMP
jgi:hypothetical protein